MLNAALIVSFPSKDRERLFTTVNTPVSDRENMTLVRLLSTQIHLRNHFNHTTVWSEEESTEESAMTAKHFSIKGQYLSEVICTFRRTQNSGEPKESSFRQQWLKSSNIIYILCLQIYYLYLCNQVFLQRKTLHVTHWKNNWKWILNW